MSFKLSVKRMAAVAALAMGMSFGVAPAQAVGPAVILVVDTQGVFAQSKAGQSIRSQYEEQAKKIMADGKKTDDALQADAKKLSDERALLSQEDLQKRAQGLQQRNIEFQQSMQIKQQGLQLGVQRAEAQVEAALRPIFAEIMKEKGGTILLDQAVVLAGGADLDISAEVLKRLNEKLAKVDVKPLTKEEMEAAQKAANGQ
ncbi:MAG: OmpH family outer membrane protein [Alphaproteobacteria bacterium]|nr:OmpH family outer membrane protein [Alphaproteobacteria bacterium]MDX5414920.1 OmpH family outer membrane protein [Alphaproteobacteria bacterium]MDX5492101.1 OmpH family outer membrane protein [Alphaproteobacteria bacterium]